MDGQLLTTYKLRNVPKKEEWNELVNIFKGLLVHLRELILKKLYESTQIWCIQHRTLMIISSKLTNCWHWLIILACLPTLIFVTTLTLGLRLKQKGLQAYMPKGSPGVTSHTPGSVRKSKGVNPHTPNATPTLGDGVSVDSKNFKERFQGSKLNFL